MTETMGDRLGELRRMAAREGLADQVHTPGSITAGIGAYADLLGLDPELVYDLSYSLSRIRELSK